MEIMNPLRMLKMTGVYLADAGQWIVDHSRVERRYTDAIGQGIREVIIKEIDKRKAK